MNKARLLKLAEHLESGKLGHKEFTIHAFNLDAYTVDDRVYYKEVYERRCGTTGCAIGECPIVFPEWNFDDFGMPVLQEHTRAIPSAVEFFGITLDQAVHLFISNGYSKEYGGKPYRVDATAQDVADNIRAFCSL